MVISYFSSPPSPSPLPTQALETINLLCLCGFACFGRSIQMELCMRLFISGLFNLG